MLINKKHSFLYLFIFLLFSKTHCNNVTNLEPIQIKEQVSKELNQETEKEKIINNWDKISELYLPSISQKIQKNHKKETYEENIKKDPDYYNNSNTLKRYLNTDELSFEEQVIKYILSEEEYKKTAYNENSAIFDDTTYRDLNVFCGKAEDPQTNLIKFIDNTQTIAGKMALLKMLYTPLTNINDLKARQNKIKFLVKNEELFKFIKEKLEEIKNSEKTISVILDKMHFDFIKAITSNYYFENIFDTPGVSTVTNLPFVSLLQQINKFSFMKNLNKSIAEKLNKMPKLLDLHIKENLLNKIIISPIVTLFVVYKFFGESLYAKTQEEDFQIYSLFTSFSSIKNIAACISSILGFYFLIKFNFKSTKDSIAVEKTLHKVTVTIAKMTNAVKAIQLKLKEYSELNDIIEYQDLTDEIKEDNFENFLNLLEDEEFKNEETSWLKSKGKMIAILGFLEKLRYKLLIPYIEIGKIDALMSAATLYKKYENHPNARYYFANYEEQDNPKLSLKNFWNPFLNTDTVITNSIELGTENKHKNVLITGPNAGGKSTALKAIAFAALLSQTLTIANANITLTPFTKIFTTLNITDTVGKESLYQADKNRIKKVTSVLRNLDKDQKALLISDEMFNSTGAAYGSALFYGTLYYISESLKNTVFAAATHFDNLTDLEKDTYGTVGNFCVEEAKLGSDGKLTWTYKIKPGINQQNIAFELAQEDGFDSKILEAGLKMLEKTNKENIFVN